MDDLIAFLRARLIDDRAHAQRLYKLAHILNARHQQPWSEQPDENNALLELGAFARRLETEADAKRQILGEHEPTLRAVEWPHDQTGKGEALVCPRCQNAENDSEGWHPAVGEAGVFPHENFVTSYVLAPCRTLRLLALPDAGHPEYRAEWKP